MVVGARNRVEMLLATIGLWVNWNEKFDNFVYRVMLYVFIMCALKTEIPTLGPRPLLT